VPCTYDDRFRHTLHQSAQPQLDNQKGDAFCPEYDSDKPAINSAQEPVSKIDSSAYDVPSEPLNLLESAERRLLELRLLHHYLTQTWTTFPGSQNPIVRDIWTTSIPKMINNHPSLLYAILSVSASHLSRLEPGDIQLQNAHRTYYILALQNHRFAINRLDDTNNTDATCFTSILIFINAYTALQDRVIEEPYDPPMQWLRVSNGARNIFQLALQSVQYNPKAVVHDFIKSLPALSDITSLLRSPNGKEFSNLLLPVKTGDINEDLQDEAELQHEETREAYANTITYLGSMHMAIKRKEHRQEICRWIMAFAVFVPRKMIWLIEAKRPRAFVVLAHYFALVGSQNGAMEAVWWIGQIARREIEAIQRFLPDAWQHLMSWPLAVTGADGPAK